MKETVASLNSAVVHLHASCELSRHTLLSASHQLCPLHAGNRARITSVKLQRRPSHHSVPLPCSPNTPSNCLGIRSCCTPIHRSIQPSIYTPIHPPRLPFAYQTERSTLLIAQSIVHPPWNFRPPVQLLNSSGPMGFDLIFFNR